MHTANQADKWIDLIAEVCREYPRFPRITVERLVVRTAHELDTDPAGPAAVRDTVLSRLQYANQLLSD